MARVLKARYFRYSDIMKAGLGATASYVWRSLLWGRDLLAKGICWRVGNGMNISATPDPWIPGIPYYTRFINARENQNEKVANYFNESGMWDEDLVRQNFSVIEAEAILDIPLNRLGCDDLRIWLDSPNGKYAMKYGYFKEINGSDPPAHQSFIPFAMVVEVYVESSYSTASEDIFGRASKDSNSWEVEKPSCADYRYMPFMQISYATTSHCILFCDMVRKGWNATVFWHYLSSLKRDSFLECCLVLSKALKKEVFELFAIKCWALWNEICKCTHTYCIKKVDLKGDSAGTLLEVYHKSTFASKITVMHEQIKVIHKWKKPIPNQLRFGVDAGCSATKKLYSLAAVIRNSCGTVVGAKAISMRGSRSVLLAELEVIRFGMDFGKLCGCSNLYIFTDSLLAAQFINQKKEELRIESNLIKEI